MPWYTSSGFITTSLLKRGRTMGGTMAHQPWMRSVPRGNAWHRPVSHQATAQTASCKLQAALRVSTPSMTSLSSGLLRFSWLSATSSPLAFWPPAVEQGARLLGLSVDVLDDHTAKLQSHRRPGR